MAPLRPYLEASVPADHYGVLGFGSRFPIFAPPPGFVQRLGANASDFFLSGTYVSGGVRIGFLRIPSMSPPSTSAALTRLNTEIAFFNDNTDGLVVDVMRNPGGLINFSEAVAQRLIPTPFRTVGFELRATAGWLESFDNAVVGAELGGAPPEVVQNLNDIFDEIQRAFGESRGRTAPVSLNPTGSLTLPPSPVVYQKPLMVLVDGMSASSADMFPAIIQDNHRGPLFGTRTMGAGGNVVSMNATSYTEGTAFLTLSLMNRGVTVITNDFPPTPYIENVGVRPDLTADYKTRANHMSAGQPFVQAFTQAIVKLVQTGSPN
jgi:C-terminal processing protease CtpA/Prc